VLAWIGGYDLVYYSWSSARDTAVLCVALGTILLIMTDSFYANAGIHASLFPNLCYYSTPILWGRTLVALAASMLLWTGAYTLLDEHTLHNSMLRNIAYYIAGSAGLVATNTYYDMAFIYPPGHNTNEFINHTSPAHKHILITGRAAASIISQNLMWVGMYNLLEDYTTQSIWREIAYIACGIMVFNATNIFVPLSWIIVDADGNQNQIQANFYGKEHKHQQVMQNHQSIAFFARATVAIFAQIAHNTGIWSLLDNYIAPQVDSLSRNLICLSVGLFLLGITGVLVQNACITPMMAPIWDAPVMPSDENIIAAIQAAEETENPPFDPQVLNSAVSIMPTARGRLQRRRLETEFDGSRALSSRYEPVSQLDPIPES
jgi:succinate dehydrogenase hydrophobic anchor subunit